MADNPPPVQVRKISFSQLVRKADPRYDREFNWSLEYDFSDGHRFFANPQQRGAYDPNFPSHEDTINGNPAPTNPP